MNTSQKILKILLENRGRFCSGTEIGRRLGISCSAVSRNISSLKERNLAVESNPGQGHRLAELPEGLHPDILQLKINDITSDLEFQYREQVESTNTLLKQIAGQQTEASSGSDQDILLLASEQTAGRGRRNRSWDSPRSQGLYFSLLLHPDISSDRAPLLTGLTSLALERALKQHGFPVQLKWPNDLLLAGRKVAGILAEISTDMDRVSHVIIGVGLNTTRTSFPRELKNRATSLKQYLQQQPVNNDSREHVKREYTKREHAKEPPKRISQIASRDNSSTQSDEITEKSPTEIPQEEILLDFLREFCQLFDLFTTGREAEVIADWKISLQIIGKEIAISTGSQEIRGEVRDISPRGELVLQTEKGEEQSFWAGDVTVIS